MRDLLETLLFESEKPNPDDVFKSATPEEVEGRMSPTFKKLKQIFGGEYSPDNSGQLKVRDLSPEEFAKKLEPFGFHKKNLCWPGSWRNYTLEDSKGGRIYYKVDRDYIGDGRRYIWVSEQYPPIFESKPNPDDIFKSATPEEMEERIPPVIRKLLKLFGGHYSLRNGALWTIDTTPEDFEKKIATLGFKRDPKSWPDKYWGFYAANGTKGDALYYQPRERSITHNNQKSIIHVDESEKPNPDDIFKSVTDEEAEQRIPSKVKELAKFLGGKIIYEDGWILQETGLTFEQFFKKVSKLPGFKYNERYSSFYNDEEGLQLIYWKTWNVISIDIDVQE